MDGLDTMICLEQTATREKTQKVEEDEYKDEYKDEFKERGGEAERE